MRARAPRRFLPGLSLVSNDNDMTVSATTSRHCHDTRPDTVSVADAALILGVTERTIARLVARKTLRSRKKKGRRLIVRQSLQDYLNEERSQSASLDSIERRLAKLEQLLLGVIELYKPGSLSTLNQKRELLEGAEKQTALEKYDEEK